MADTGKASSVLVALCVMGGCAEARDGTATGLGEPAPMSGDNGDNGDDDGGDMGDADDDAGSEGTGTDDGDSDNKLDLPEEPDGPAQECATIEQSTTIEDRPSDIIVIADDEVSREFVQDNITNLLPGMETEGVFDATVVLLASGAPPQDPDDEFSCGVWNCRGAERFGAFHPIDTPISPTALLSDLLEAHEDWTPHLRDSSWKHFWVMTTRAADPTIDNATFLEEIAALVGGDTGYSVHTVVGEGEDGAVDPEGYAGLAELTDGVYSSGDYNLFDFQDPMIERIHGTSLACEYDIPEPPEGLVFDRDKVNVIYDAGAGPEAIGHVMSATDCLAVGRGWYYDDALTPARILMCPAACEQLATLTEATIEIEFGCDTIPAG